MAEGGLDEHTSWRCYHNINKFCPAEGCSMRDGCARDNIIETLRAWHAMQSTPNTTALYQAASRLFGSKFNPAEYVAVE